MMVIPQSDLRYMHIKENHVHVKPTLLFAMFSVSLLYLVIIWLLHNHAINAYLGTDIPLDVIDIPKCSHGNLYLRNFTISNGNGKPEYDTNVFVCYRPKSIFDETPYALLIEYKMNDETPSSPYNQCNQPLYEYDAVEFFIAPYIYEQTPTSYVEIEINPNGALFVSTIENTCDNCSCIQGTPISCNAQGIIAYNATIAHNRDGQYLWSAYIEITFEFINKYADYVNANHNMYRINFFRIDDLNKNGNNVTQYSCYNPTMLTPPCFHVPSSFGYFQLH
eukprot:199926_1